MFIENPLEQAFRIHTRKSKDGKLLVCQRNGYPHLYSEKQLRKLAKFKLNTDAYLKAETEMRRSPAAKSNFPTTSWLNVIEEVMPVSLPPLSSVYQTMERLGLTTSNGIAWDTLEVKMPKSGVATNLPNGQRAYVTRQIDHELYPLKNDLTWEGVELPAIWLSARYNKGRGEEMTFFIQDRSMWLARNVEDQREEVLLNGANKFFSGLLNATGSDVQTAAGLSLGGWNADYSNARKSVKWAMDFLMFDNHKKGPFVVFLADDLYKLLPEIIDGQDDRTIINELTGPELGLPNLTRENIIRSPELASGTQVVLNADPMFVKWLESGGLQLYERPPMNATIGEFGQIWVYTSGGFWMPIDGNGKYNASVITGLEV
jgi:hypothetical protein